MFVCLDKWKILATSIDAKVKVKLLAGRKFWYTFFFVYDLERIKWYISVLTRWSISWIFNNLQFNRNCQNALIMILLFVSFLMFWLWTNYIDVDRKKKRKKEKWKKYVAWHIVFFCFINKTDRWERLLKSYKKKKHSSSCVDGDVTITNR
jgi:hypothetical protein